jgi:YfiH family protein
LLRRDEPLSIVRPSLTEVNEGDVRWWTDAALLETGIFVAFSQRTGGVSERPYASLNLATHVGDAPDSVEANRERFLTALGLSRYLPDLTMAEQVHGNRVAVVARGGQGAQVGSRALPSTDGMVTSEPGVPLMMCFADCVPVLLVAPGPVVAVAHAGWRGALGGVVPNTVDVLVSESGSAASEMTAYIGPHICADHYQVGSDVLSHFTRAFGTLARAESGGLDLGAVLAVSLTAAGVQPCRIADLGLCTAEETDRLFSHRAESGLTGRHGALVCIAS